MAKAKTADAANNLRGSITLGIFRWIQLIVTGAVLGVCGTNAFFWHNLGCNNPTRLTINMAMAGATVPIVLYLWASSWPLNKCLKFLRLNRWLQFFMDALCCATWVVAAILSYYNCSDLCNACSAPGKQLGGAYTVWAGSLTCDCVIPGMLNTRNDMTLVPRKGGKGGSHSGGGGGSKSKSKKPGGSDTHTSLDWFMAILFLITTLLTLIFMFKDHRAKKNSHKNNVNPAQGGAVYAMQDDPKYQENASLIHNASSIQQSGIAYQQQPYQAQSSAYPQTPAPPYYQQVPPQYPQQAPPQYPAPPASPFQPGVQSPPPFQPAGPFPPAQQTAYQPSHVNPQY